MSRRGARPIIFVCACIGNAGELITEPVVASTQEGAICSFRDKYGYIPTNILGPFYQKKSQVLENTTAVKFTGVIKKAEYNGWYVNAIMLAEPVDHAYLIFTGRIDNKKMSAPKGTIVVPCSNLRIIQDA